MTSSRPHWTTDRPGFAQKKNLDCYDLKGMGALSASDNRPVPFLVRPSVLVEQHESLANMAMIPYKKAAIRVLDRSSCDQQMKLPQGWKPLPPKGNWTVRGVCKISRFLHELRW